MEPRSDEDLEQELYRDVESQLLGSNHKHEEEQQNNVAKCARKSQTPSSSTKPSCSTKLFCSNLSQDLLGAVFRFFAPLAGSGHGKVCVEWHKLYVKLAREYFVQRLAAVLALPFDPMLQLGTGDSVDVLDSDQSVRKTHADSGNAYTHAGGLLSDCSNHIRPDDNGQLLSAISASSTESTPTCSIHHTPSRRDENNSSASTAGHSVGCCPSSIGGGCKTSAGSTITRSNSIITKATAAATVTTEAAETSSPPSMAKHCHLAVDLEAAVFRICNQCISKRYKNR